MPAATVPPLNTAPTCNGVPVYFENVRLNPLIVALASVAVIVTGDATV